MNTPVRTRIAPSPTGDPHIGTAFMALFNYAFARKNGGQFLLRVEDTDQARSTRESELAIYEALNWVGIPWDEGPDKNGPYEPYRQSERTEIYREHARKLIDAGHAYPCFCTTERLDDLRRRQQLAKQPAGYDAKCAAIPRDEAAARMAAGETHVVRMKVPVDGDCIIQDRLRGKVVIPWANVDHQILLKSDGFPTYHLANVVDDHLMQITHVIRGEEWISSAPKHQLLYQYFGWKMPELVHLPLLRNPDKSKLSKRKNPTSILYYRQAGFLPEALLNYLGMMGYTMPDGREFFSIDEFVESFDIDRISLGGPIFDLQKLTWLNGRYLRERMQPEELLARLKAWTLNDATWMKLLPLAQTRIEKLADLVQMTAFVFADKLEYATEFLLAKGMDGEKANRLLKIAQWELEKLRVWSKEAIGAILTTICEKEELKPRDTMPLFFTAITGAPTSIPLFDAMEILGSDMSRRRLVYAQEKLAIAGFETKGKALKELETHYAKNYGAAS